MSSTIGKAPLTSVRLQSGARWHVDQGAPVPASADPEDVARLVEEGFLEVVDSDEVSVVPEPTPSPSTDLADLPDEELVKRGVDKVLDTVGDDAERAARLLELETGEGGKNRAGMVKGLQEAIDAAAAGGGG